MSDPKTTDQRQAQGIAWAVIDRLDVLGGTALALEGRNIVQCVPIDWAALLDWNRRACEWLIRENRRNP